MHRNDCIYNSKVSYPSENTEAFNLRHWMVGMMLVATIQSTLDHTVGAIQSLTDSASIPFARLVILQHIKRIQIFQRAFACPYRSSYAFCYGVHLRHNI